MTEQDSNTETRQAKSNNGGSRSRIRQLTGQREFIMLLVVIAFAIIMAVSSPIFLTWLNIEAILMALTVEATIAIGMVVLLISGGLDLSVGSTLAFAGVVAGLVLTSLGLGAVPAIIIALLAALGVGLVNGVLVSKLKINPFITTLGTMITVRGLVLILASGRAILNLPDSFKVIGQGRAMGIQYPIFVLLVLVIGGDLLLRYSRFFRQSYYIGGNEDAARLSGINVDLVKILYYCLAALLAGAAGLMLTARFGSASLTVGTGVELRVITACIIGGASLSGGEGSVLGAFLGALFMGMLANALNLLGVDVYYQSFFTGLILILAVVFSVLNDRRKLSRT
jgi:ribose transport system permease protein